MTAPDTAPEGSKLWTESRTIWFNLLAVLPLVVDVLVAVQTSGAIDLLPPSWAAPIHIAIVVGNIALRSITRVPIRLR